MCSRTQLRTLEPSELMVLTSVLEVLGSNTYTTATVTGTIMLTPIKLADLYYLFMYS
jgi:hypothetical protein